MRKGILMVISGFSGAGKGTLVKRLLAEHEDYVLSVSMTTRKPREGEREGVDYFFTDRETFEKTIEEGGLIEYANYVGN
jgi:guanylate kinase